jgi:rod shape-determining protein MreC
MRNLLLFFLRNYFVFLFLLLEGLSFALIFQYNEFQRSGFVSSTRSLTSALQDNFSGYRSFFHLRIENELLSNENAQLKNELSRKGVYEEVPGMVIDTVSKTSYQYIPSRVITSSVNKQYNYLTVNKGRRQGVYPDMAAISATGAVGIVVAVSENYSTIIPILNRNFRLSARLKKNKFFGIIEWEGRSAEFVSFKEIPVHVDVQAGDSVVTSGFSAVFPENIMVGTVESVENSGGNFHDIKIRLSTDYRKLYHVKLIRFSNKAEVEELENRTKND